MAEIKQASKRNVCSVFEDINPSTNTIYLESEGHNKSTLAPIFNGSMYMYTGQPKDSLWGQNIYINADETHVQRSGDGASTMALGKEVAYCNQEDNTVANHRVTNIPFLQYLSMEESRRGTGMQRITADDGTDLYVWQNRPMFYNWYRQISWLNPSRELYQASPTTSWGYDGQGSSSEIMVPTMATEEEVGTKWVSNICQQVRFDSYVARPHMGLGRNYMLDYSDTNDNWNTTMRAPYSVQYIGMSNIDGKPIYLYNNQDIDHDQYITKHNVSLNTTTDLHRFSAAPSAAGTNYGGTRATTTIGRHVKWASHTFDDPTSAGNKCFYVPYLDANLNYHPFWYQWNKSTDTFTKNSDITITGDVSSTHFNNHYGGQGDNSDMSAYFYNETFVSSGNRYLSLFPIHGYYQCHDSTPAARTVVTYQVNAADPKQLTHHSTVTIPATPRNMVFLNDSRTMFGVIGENAIYIFSWNNVDGWVLTTTYAGKFTSLGRDTTDRIWATEVGAFNSYASIHIITPSIPVKISITPAATNYNYAGSDINTTVVISAYNASGDRIAVDVALTIDGSTMNFGGGATTTTVTTSTTADVSQAVVITGAGLSDIVASVSI
jgi:hypothetical protein